MEVIFNLPVHTYHYCLVKMLVSLFKVGQFVRPDRRLQPWSVQWSYWFSDRGLPDLHGRPPVRAGAQRRQGQEGEAFISGFSSCLFHSGSSRGIWWNIHVGWIRPSTVFDQPDYSICISRPGQGWEGPTASPTSWPHRTGAWPHFKPSCYPPRTCPRTYLRVTSFLPFLWCYLIFI